MSDDRTLPEEPSGELVTRDVLFPEQDHDEVEPRKPLTAKAVAIVGARFATGLIGIGVAAATIAAAALLPLPNIHSAVPSALITPVPTAQQLVCPGAVLRLADEAGQGATTSSAIGRPSTRFGSSTGSATSTPLKDSDASTGGSAAAPSVISTPPNPADPTAQLLLSGAQSQSVNEAEFVGLTAADCGVANGDTWLAGGSTTVGRTTLLTLSNPTEVPATVNIQLFGENGAITAPGTSGIIVAANGQRVLSLAGFQPNIASPVVHVSSTGGQVVADLQQSIVRGLDPGGVDIIGPSGSPSKSTVIPGVLVPDVVSVQNLLVGGADYNDLATVLRLYAPGEGTVSTTISVIPEDANSNGTSFAYDIDAGRVTDVPIGDLDSGSYTVKVQSSAPLVASARVSTAAGAATDFAWLAASTELDEHAQVTIAPGPSPVLHIANAGTVAITVTLAALGGADLSVSVPAGASALVPVVAGETYQLSGFSAIFAAVTLTEGGGIARYAVHPPGAGSTPVRVFR